MSVIKKLTYLLTSRERKKAGLLMLMIMIMALLDMVGVASIMPFMAILIDPGLVDTNPLLNRMFIASSIFGVNNNQEFLFATGILVFILLLTSLTFKAATIYAQTRFVQMREHTIGRYLVENFLHQPYAWFLNRHSAELGKSVLSEVSFIVGKGLQPMITLIAQTTVTIALLTLIVLTDPKLAIIIISTLGGAYFLIYKLTRNILNRIGKQRLKANESRFTAVVEAFGAVKEIKVGRLENIFVKRFSSPSLTSASHTAYSQIISHLPRFALESIAFGGMLLVILYFISQSGTFTKAVPIIALYAFTGYRLMPALQQIFGSITQIRFVGPSLDKLYNDLKSLEPVNLNNDEGNIELRNSIILNKISYDYPNVKKPALKDINISIPARNIIGFAGETGSGKTTLVDIILGLLEIKEGKLQIDGEEINKNNIRAWQRNIGYVPQQIFLADDTIAANIAFGTEFENIDQKAVENAAKIACLHDFIINELPLNYQTAIGERGIRLSGGQRQRIGIARALYHKPKILIFDEATSALDNLTEKAVMDAVLKISKNITIIMIAHRLSSLKNCDTIFFLEKGEVKAQGTFEELIHSNNKFRASALSI